MEGGEAALYAGEVADGLGVQAEDGDDAEDDEDGREAARNGLGQARKKGDDGHGDEDERTKDGEVGAREPVTVVGLELGDLAAADDDGEAVHKAEDDGLGHEAHELAEPHEAGRTLDEAGEDDRGEDVFRSVREGELGQHHRDGSRRTADHAGTATEYAGHEPHHEGGVEAGEGTQLGDEGEGNGLGNERHGDGQSAEDLEAVIDGLPEVEEGEAHGVVGAGKRAQKYILAFRWVNRRCPCFVINALCTFLTFPMKTLTA